MSEPNLIPNTEAVKLSETWLLWAVMVDPSLLDQINLQPDEFYTRSLRWAWEALLALRSEGRPIDFAILAGKLQEAGKLEEIGGMAEMASWGHDAPPSQNAPEYARIIRQYARMRQTEVIAAELVKRARKGKFDYQDLTERLAGLNGNPNGKVPLQTAADLAKVIGPIAWEWRGWLPRGMLVILAGESGAGKSALALRIAQSFIKGIPWPDKAEFTGEIGTVVWCEAEAAQALLMDRIKSWKITPDWIYFPGKAEEDFSLDNPSHRQALLEKAFLPEVRLIIVDSLRGAQNQDENSSDTMATVKWLAELARDSGKPVLLTHHLRKKTLFDDDGRELQRLRGSSAIVQAARVVWALDVPDPESKNWTRLQVIKSNLAKFPEPVGLTIDDAGVRFGLSPLEPKKETVLDRAVELLLTLLGEEPIPYSEIESAIDSAQISKGTLKRAKEKLRINSVKKGDFWYWSLPPGGNSVN